MWQTRLLDERCGAVVEASRVNILGLDVKAVRRWVMTHGAVLFRSFATDASSFVTFTDQFLDKALVHGAPSRRAITSDGTLQEITPGCTDIAPHAELALTPRRPDLLWFYCKKPAAAGGESLICDGVRIFSALKPETRELFTGNKLRYVVRILRGYMKRSFPALTYEEAIRRLASNPGEGNTIRMTEDGGESSYVTSAVVTTRWGGQPAFANSIRGPYELTRKWVGFDQAGDIPDEVMAELCAVTERESVAVKLQAGDILMIDNSRVMHGRRSFAGERLIYVRMGSANW